MVDQPVISNHWIQGFASYPCGNTKPEGSSSRMSQPRRSLPCSTSAAPPQSSRYLTCYTYTGNTGENPRRIQAPRHPDGVVLPRSVPLQAGGWHTFYFFVSSLPYRRDGSFLLPVQDGISQWSASSMRWERGKGGCWQSPLAFRRVRVTDRWARTKSLKTNLEALTFKQDKIPLKKNQT